MRLINTSCGLKVKALSWWLSEKSVLLNSTRRSRGKGGLSQTESGVSENFMSCGPSFLLFKKYDSTIFSSREVEFQ
jgi:hypothetical protein